MEIYPFIGTLITVTVQSGKPVGESTGGKTCTDKVRVMVVKAELHVREAAIGRTVNRVAYNDWRWHYVGQEELNAMNSLIG